MSDELSAENLAQNGVTAASAASTAWITLADFENTNYSREEIEAAFHEYVARANANEWDAWCDIFTEDVLYVDHQFGVLRGREEVRKWMVPLMKSQPEMKFPVGWHAIRGDVVINYNWNRWPNPDGSGEPYDDVENPGAPMDQYLYQFPAVTITIYGGNGMFKYEEDLYSPNGYMKVVNDWQEEMRRLGRPIEGGVA